MAIAACPLDDDIGTCKLISLQFLVSPLALCVRLMIILCLMELVRDERQREREREREREIERDLEDSSRLSYISRRNSLIYQLFFALTCTEHMD